MVALHSSSFSAAGGKSRSSCARTKASAGVGGDDSCVDRPVATQRLRAIFASTSAGMLNSFIPWTTHRALPTAVPRVTNVVTLLGVHTMGRARGGRRCERLGGRCAARRWHNDTPGGPRAASGGPSSVFGSGGVRPIVWGANDAARQALTAWAMLVFADCGQVLFATGPLPVRTGTGRSAPNERIAVAVFFLGAMATKNC